MQIAIDPPISAPRSLSAFEIEFMVDSPTSKTVTATVAIAGLDNPVSFVLWSGDAYDTAGAEGDGQWTDADAQARVQALIAANYGE